MAIKSGILLLTLLVGCLAIPKPEDDMSVFFDKVDPSARIIGGTEAFAGSHPHMVAMSSGTLVRSFLCGGSLVTTRTVLTAAHCIAAVFSWGSLTSTLRVTVGTNRWNSGGTAYSLSRNVTHPNYVSTTIKNDIGLLITATNVVMGPLVNSIPLSYDYAQAGLPVRVAGWGRTATGGALSATLRELDTWVYNEQSCVQRVPAVAAQVNVRMPPVEPHIEICTFVMVRIPKPDVRKSNFFEHVDKSSRIVGGTPAAAGSHPHMVALTTGYIIPSFFCGASLISTRTVLTAGHCVEAVFDDEESILAKSLRGRVGSNLWIIGGTSIKFTNHITNPNYDSDLIKNDLGLLITTSEVKLSPVINPVPLSFDTVPGDVDVKVAGWGITSNGGALSYILLELALSTIDGKECSSLIEQVAAENNINAPPVNPEVEICTLHSVGHGVCNGDSGSALVEVSSGKQVGIVSWGFPCALGVPDMFTRVSGFQSWLNESIVL